jgi:hypothetical protein
VAKIGVTRGKTITQFRLIRLKLYI